MQHDNHKKLYKRKLINGLGLYKNKLLKLHQILRGYSGEAFPPISVVVLWDKMMNPG